MMKDFANQTKRQLLLFVLLIGSAYVHHLSAQPNNCGAGISPGTLSFCGEESICLSDYLLGDLSPSGLWTGPAGWTADGTLCGNFNSGTDPLGDYTYSVIDNDGEICSATITIVENDGPPSEDNNATQNYCTNIGTVNLFELLDGTVPQDGKWTDPDGDTIQNPYFYHIDLYQFTFPWGQGGTHTYTIPDGNCAGTTTLYLSLEGMPNAGQDFNYSYCTSTYATITLGTIMSQTADTDGTFFRPNGQTIESNSSFDQVVANAGTYYYVVYGEELCPNDTALYNIDIHGPEFGYDEYGSCNPDDPTTYLFSVELTHGEPPFSSDDGIVLNDMFYSYALPLSQYTVTLTDGSGCTNEYWSYSYLDSNGNGICDSEEEIGCMDPDAPNYNPDANIPGLCDVGGLSEDFYTLTDLISEDEGGFGLTDDSSGDEPDWDFTMFPNPFQTGEDSRIELIQEEFDGPYTLRCFDMSGKMVFNQLIQAQNEISQISFPTLSQFQTGIYLVILTDKKGLQQQEILIKTR